MVAENEILRFNLFDIGDGVVASRREGCVHVEKLDVFDTRYLGQLRCSFLHSFAH